MSVTDLISQVGGTIGTVGSAVATYLATQIRTVRTATAAAKKAREGAEEARDSARSILTTIETLARGVRMELDHIKTESFRTPVVPFDPHAPTPSEIGRRLDELSKRLEECRSDILRERGARHAMQHTLAEESREDEKQWREFHRILGEIQGELRARESSR